MPRYDVTEDLVKLAQDVSVTGKNFSQIIAMLNKASHQNKIVVTHERSNATTKP
jgi:hypothetical protein